jgi:hypothetical protein
MNGETEKIWKEVYEALSRYHPGISLQGLRIFTSSKMAFVSATVE